VSAAENPRPRHRTLSDVYAERSLSAAQVRRIVALLRLTEQPAGRRSAASQEAA
jgi:hypothetical protein